MAEIASSSERAWVPSVLMVALAAMLVGCSASEKLKDYPEREIDRPYTLPKGVASWQTYFAIDHEKDPDGFDDSSSVLYPFIWNQALSDTWQLSWLPVPLVASHEIEWDETGYWGMSFGTGASYGDFEGFSLLPTVSLTRRWLLSASLALDANVAADFKVPFRSETDFEWQTGVNVSPLFQLGTRFAVGPTASWVLQDQVFTEIAVQDSRFTLSTHRSHRSRFPIGARASWLMSRQWELSFTETYNRLGYEAGYSRNMAIFTMTHFW